MWRLTKSNNHGGTKGRPERFEPWLWEVWRLAKYARVAWFVAGVCLLILVAQFFSWRAEQRRIARNAEWTPQKIADYVISEWENPDMPPAPD